MTNTITLPEIKVGDTVYKLSYPNYQATILEKHEVAKVTKTTFTTTENKKFSYEINVDRFSNKPYIRIEERPKPNYYSSGVYELATPELKQKLEESLYKQNLIHFIQNIAHYKHEELSIEDLYTIAKILGDNTTLDNIYKEATKRL